MTPTKEMIAMAERIADQTFGDRNDTWLLGYKAALTAMMETSARCANYAEGFASGILCETEGDKAPYRIVAGFIRNGEHLR